MTRSPRLEEALDATPDAGLVSESGAPTSRKAEAWALYGYDRWLEDQERQQKIDSYTAIGADNAHLDDIRASSRRAVEAGIL